MTDLAIRTPICWISLLGQLLTGRRGVLTSGWDVD